VTAQLIFLSVDLATIVLFALFGLRIATVRPKRRESWLIVLLCVASIVHVALSRAEYGYWIAGPFRFSFGMAAPFMNVARNMTPGLFALLTAMLFTDRRRQPPWLYGLIAGQIVLEILRVLALRGADTLSAWLQVAFAATAIYWTIGYWRADLIEARRRTRAVVAIILSINVVASTILLRLILSQDTIENYYGHVVLSVATLALMIFLVMRLMNGEIGVLSDNRLPASPPAPLETPNQIADRRPSKARPAAEEIRKSEDELALKRLDTLLGEQHIHRESGLSLQQLAERVGLPEYRMRQLIHEHLRFRNFNSFLHAYRIRDAVEQLANPERRATPILTIAQSVGYESVNTFNRGFKEVMDMTPSEYRERERTNAEEREGGRA
jgi:AraC-like DNA-binding protein